MEPENERETKLYLIENGKLVELKKEILVRGFISFLADSLLEGSLSPEDIKEILESNPNPKGEKK